MDEGGDFWNYVVFLFMEFFIYGFVVFLFVEFLEG